MSDENESVKNQKENTAGCFALGFSFLIPIVGVICYFAYKDKVVNPKSYLNAALAGFILSVFLNLIVYVSAQ